ncbi:MAG: LacI family transcriptional regulator [Streptococcaceae bacterium]|jgi:LacI family transcriptional regulator|nr:LacI family transcriptional regulator [Streptococcaceae bacterium]
MSTHITIKDLAKIAGVSAMTVSNVIRGKDSEVSATTRKKIKNLMEDYQYVPNQNASNLKSKQSHLIGVLLYNKRQFLDFADPFVSSVLTGISDEAKRHGYFIMVDIIQSAKEIEVLERNWNFAGFVMIGMEHQHFQELDSVISIPVTYVDSYCDDVPSTLPKLRNFIGTNDAEISQTAAQYLSENGHEKVLCFSFDFHLDDISVMQQRVTSFTSNFKGEIFYGTTNSSDYQEILEQVQDYLIKQPFTAIYATADILAVKLNQIFKDISIIGVDDAPFAEFMTPKLTTVKIDQVEKGKLALSVLVESIEKDKSKKNLLGGQLIIRESVKKRLSN